jgi:hypothetical protein
MCQNHSTIENNHIIRLLWLCGCFQWWDGSNALVVVIVFLFMPPWRWPHKWRKHVVGCPVIKLYRNIILYLLVLILHSPSCMFWFRINSYSLTWLLYIFCGIDILYRFLFFRICGVCIHKSRREVLFKCSWIMYYVFRQWCMLVKWTSCIDLFSSFWTLERLPEWRISNCLGLL